MSKLPPTESKANQPTGMLYYDAQCELCSNLAVFVQKRSDLSLQIAPSSDLDEKIASKSSTIIFYFDNEFYFNNDAWLKLIEQHPDFKQFNWLAAKLGLVPQLASTLNRIAKGVRWLCPSCGYLARKKRRSQRK